ncbi:MAG: molybdopterin dehydrogenase, partial [Clostridia bacterium]|nr:molybdopterin dehydrogenase [Clostridia bacterium]
KMGNGSIQTAIDLSNLGMDKIEETEEEYRIGCMVSLRELEENQGLADYTQGALKEALRHIVGVQFRNLATVGGSIYGKFGFSDVLTMFLVMDSYVELYKHGIIPLREYAANDYGRDILIRIIVKKTKASYIYQSVRNSKTDFPVLACAAAKTEAGKYLFSVGARPARAILLLDEENLLEEKAGEVEAEAFAAYAKKKIVTGTNIRGSAEYRTHLTGVLLKRAILRLA